MKKIIVFAAFCAAALSLSAVSADAKASDPVHYRTEGYRGSVSLTNQYLAWIGVDTSHGYMFDEHHYLGAGAGLFIVPGATPPFAHIFMEYKAYILKKNSTPVAGFKFGWMGPLNGDAPGDLQRESGSQSDPRPDHLLLPGDRRHRFRLHAQALRRPGILAGAKDPQRKFHLRT